jgi:hypothetical protein
MTQWLDRYNLTAGERRLVWLGVVVFALLFHFWFVAPLFEERHEVTKQWEEQSKRKRTFGAEISKRPQYERQLRALEGAGGQVLPEEQANRVQSTIVMAAGNHGVNITRNTPQNPNARLGPRADTNFFDEQIVVVDVVAKEDGLVNFLHSLGASDSMIRVRDLARLRLDPSQQNLMASVTLVASFQKAARPAAKPAAPAATPAAASGAGAASKPPGARATNAPTAAAAAEPPGFFQRLWNRVAGSPEPKTNSVPVQPAAAGGVSSRVLGRNTNAPPRN